MTTFLVVKQSNGELLASPDIISRGFIYMREAEDLMHKLREEVKTSYARAKEQHGINSDETRQAMRDALSQFLFQATGRNPLVIPVITTIA